MNIMKPIKKSLVLSRQKYYETHLLIVSSVLPIKLTPKEVEVLASFMCLDESKIKDRFGIVGRALVKDSLNLSPSGLSNYMKALKDKKYIYDKDGITEINPILIINDMQQEYYFKLQCNESTS